jgi:hypothetical protein
MRVSRFAVRHNFAAAKTAGKCVLGSRIILRRPWLPVSVCGAKFCGRSRPPLNMLVF